MTLLTKADLVKAVSQSADLPAKHASVIVDTIFKSIIDALYRGETVEVRGFGTFLCRIRQPRTGRNPRTGAAVAIPTRHVASFKPGKAITDAVQTL